MIVHNSLFLIFPWILSMIFQTQIFITPFDCWLSCFLMGAVVLRIGKIIGTFRTAFSKSTKLCLTVSSSPFAGVAKKLWHKVRNLAGKSDVTAPCWVIVLLHMFYFKRASVLKGVQIVRKCVNSRVKALKTQILAWNPSSYKLLRWKRYLQTTYRKKGIKPSGPSTTDWKLDRKAMWRALPSNIAQVICIFNENSFSCPRSCCNYST